tara:strand:+ start:2556 stop:3041 length:486 start_codon:yes stop_codon:yes gene_type:complete
MTDMDLLYRITIYGGNMTRISLTPIIDVVFILLIFFMLATNFQSFSKTDINLSNESASITQSDKKVYVIEFDVDNKFKLNGQDYKLSTIKEKILSELSTDEDLIVVIKPGEKTNVQQMLTLIESLKKSNISNVTLGVEKNDNKYKSDDTKKMEKLPLLRKN